MSGTGNIDFGSGFGSSSTDVIGAYNVSGTSTVSGASVTFANTVLSGAFSNAGTVSIDAGITFTVNGAYTQSSGITNLDGGILKASMIDINGGTVSGLGTINGDVFNAGTLNVGGMGTTGILSITGTYTQTSAGTLDIEIGGNTAGTQYDQLVITGSASLGGTLDVSFINGFNPASGSWTVLLYASEIGTFANTPFGFSVNYGSKSVTVS